MWDRSNRVTAGRVFEVKMNKIAYLFVVSVLFACGGSTPHPTPTPAVSPKSDPVDSSGAAASASPPASLPAAAKQMFVTSLAYDGNFGGLVGADAKCTTHATAAKLTGHFVAFMSDSKTDALARITADGPWQFVGTTSVAFNNKKNLETKPQSVYWTDENGTNLMPVTPDSLSYWTGSVIGGTRATNDQVCLDWTAGNSAYGSAGYVSGHDGFSQETAHWAGDPANGNFAPCSNRLPLLCFEQ